MPLVLGSLSGYPTSQVVNGPWYKSLKRPAVEPPNKVFGIVWPILYASMGYASHLAVKAYDQNIIPASRIEAYSGLKLYYLQLGLNLAWTPLFFGAKKKGLALINIVTLTGTVYWLTATWNAPTDGRATLLLLPYCMWLTFATYLNASFWYQNREQPTIKKD
ncbi:TspO/MBR-related protein [Serendipita vermifera]|nr:TspO/MBR-related protein [Serendipita vermifera]